MPGGYQKTIWSIVSRKGMRIIEITGILPVGDTCFVVEEVGQVLTAFC